MQQITLTFEALGGENMSQDTDQEKAKTIKVAGGVDGSWALSSPRPHLSPLTPADLWRRQPTPSCSL